MLVFEGEVRIIGRDNECCVGNGGSFGGKTVSEIPDGDDDGQCLQ